MTQDEIIDKDEVLKMARKAGMELTNNHHGNTQFRCFSRELEYFAKLAAAKEREAIAQMFENAPPLVEFARNNQGGCIMCGFTPEWAVAAIRARGETTSRGEV